jgi:hypothetical protein
MLVVRVIGDDRALYIWISVRRGRDRQTWQEG